MNDSFEAHMTAGVVLGRDGKYELASVRFQAATALRPQSPDAWFNLGVALREAKSHADGKEAFKKAVELKPDWAEAWFNLGNASRDSGDREGAISCYERALGCKPQYTKALNNLGNLLRDKDEFQRAVRAFSAALQIDPANTTAAFNLGLVYERQKRLDVAVECLNRALAADPINPRFLTKLAQLQHQRGDVDGAIATLSKFPQLDPSAAMQLARMHRTRKEYAHALDVLDQCETHCGPSVAALLLKGELLREAGKLDGAIATLQHAARLAPCSAEVQVQLGLTYLAKAQPNESLQHCDQAVRLQPSLPEAHCNRGAVLQMLRRYRESEAAFDMAIRLKPDFAIAHLNKALANLARGNFENGWDEFEWRFLCPGFRMKKTPLPRWIGEEIRGKTILLRTEQGLGDTLQFVRFAQQLKQQQAKVVVECQPAVAGLVRSCPFVDEVSLRGKPPIHADVQIPLMSLPAVLGTSLSNIPNNVPYLVPASERIERWRERIRALGRIVVGIAWQGNPKFPSDHLRSFHVSNYQTLASIPGVVLVSLQKNHGSEQLRAEPGFRVHDFTDEMDNDTPFSDTAAVMASLDLIITSDTALAHLAGAMGRPVWTMLGFSADWRWLNEGSTSPWYPTMRLFRQREFGDWRSAFDEAHAELERVAQGDVTRLVPEPELRPRTTVTVPIPVGELFDRISILEIKVAKLTDSESVRFAQSELDELAKRRPTDWASRPEVGKWVEKLQKVNQQLWEVEDKLRDCERSADFGPPFVDLARSVYRLNDARAALKRALSEHFQSAFVEVKSYRPY